MKRNLMLLLAAPAALSALVGCNTSNEPGVEDKYVAVNIVTYEGTTSSGVTTFTYQALNDSPMVTLTADWDPKTELSVGSRLLISYSTNAEPNVSGDIYLRQVAKLYGGQVTMMANESEWDTQRVKLNSLWRTGHYINLDCLAQFATGTRVIDMAVDSTTLSDAVPVLYLTVRGSNNDVAVYDQRIYASWDIDTIWSRPDVTGIRVKIKDTDHDLNNLTFQKTVD